MKVSPQQVTLDTTAKTAQLSEGYKDTSRELLIRVATDLVRDDGTVKSGYLKLKMSDDGLISISSNNIGAGATAATDLVKRLVLDAYGPEAREALDEYLQAKGKDKVGTLSFVKLIQTMEKDFNKPEDLRLATAPQLAKAKGLDSGSMVTQSLISRPALEFRATSAIDYWTFWAKEYFKGVSTIADPRTARAQAMHFAQRLSAGITAAQALGWNPQEAIECRTALEAMIKQYAPQADQVEKLVADPAAEFTKLTDELANRTNITELKIQRSSLQDRLNAVHEHYVRNLDNLTKPSEAQAVDQVNAIVEQQNALMDEFKDLMGQAKQLTGRLQEEAASSLAEATQPCFEQDGEGGYRFALRATPDRQRELAACFMNARDRVVDSEASAKLDSISLQMENARSELTLWKSGFDKLHIV